MYFKSLSKCSLCPRGCLINRYKNTGFCGANSKLRLSYYSLHYWEEPILSNKNGSGTIFFSNCNLKCIFCQNKKIAEGYGKDISLKRFEEIILELQDKGANNINLVTPTHYIPQIRYVLQKIKHKALKIPVVYNTSSYDSVKSLKTLSGLVDIYLADLKYFDDELGRKYSHVDNYFKYATLAIDEMYRQVPNIKINNDIMESGLIVRVLVLPGHIDDSKKIIKYLYDKYKDNIIISIMNQYTPVYKTNYPNLNRKLSDEEYEEVINYAYDLGIRNSFIQEGDTQEESFIPDFDISVL